MFGWRSARGRAVLTGVAFIVLLAAMALVAVSRAREVQQQHRSLEHASTAIASLEHSYSQFAEGRAALSAIVMLQDPEFADSYRYAVAEAVRSLGLAQDEALARGEIEQVASLGNLTQQISLFNDEAEAGIPVVLEADQEQARQIATTVRAEAQPEAEAIQAELSRLIREGRADLAAERAAADRALGVTVALLVAFGVVAFVGGSGLVAFVIFSVVRPLGSLRASARAIASGNLDARAKVSGPTEVASLARDFNAMATERQRAEDALRQARNELETRVKERTADLTLANERLQHEVADRRRAEDALRESEAKYRSMFENVQDIFYRTDAQGMITEISPSVERYGYLREGLIGTQVLDVYEDPEERSRLLEAVLERGEVLDYEIRLKTADGRAIYTSVSTHILRNGDGSFAGVEGVLRDIGERKRMEEALRESEAKYRGIFENVQDIYYRTDERGLIIEISPSVGRYGYTREGLIGTQVLDVYEDPEERSDLLKVVLEQGEVADYEIRLKTGDGRVVDTSVSTHVIRGPDGSFEGVEGALRDIGERKRMEEALREQTRRDPLTGALNHMAIVDHLRALMSEGGGGAPSAIAMIDVDGLKATNDTYGHQVGDTVLVAVAGALSKDEATVGRYGGDEFVALLPGADRDAAERYRENVLAELAKVDLRDPETGALVPVAVSVGLAVYPTEAGRLEELIRAADSAMYAWRRQRPLGATGRALSRSLGNDRAARMVGEIVPLLTSPGSLSDKLRLVSHRLSVGAGYDAVNFQVFGGASEPPVAENTFARAPEHIVEAWARAQRQAPGVEIRQILERVRRPIIVDDPQDDQRLTSTQRELLGAAGLRSGLVAPMIWRNELIGHLAVASRRKRAFGPSDAEFLMAIATQVTAITRTATLVEELQSASDQLLDAQAETVMLLAAVAETRDHATGLHLQNVRAITEAVALELGYGEEDAAELGLAAVLHDIGKIRVPDLVVSTASELTDEEWELMRQHTVWGAEFLEGRPGFEMAASIARSHHERWDGSGYPIGLSGGDIPVPATIVAVADAFDAMTTDRPYRTARSVATAVREIVACSGQQFSPTVAQALARLHRRRGLSRLRRPRRDDRAVA